MCGAPGADGRAIDPRPRSLRRRSSLAAAVLLAVVALAGCFPVANPYRNPVYRGSFADPFVLRVERDFFAYGTNVVDGGRRVNVPVLTSPDLVSWDRAPVDALPDAGLGAWVDRSRVPGRIWAPAVLARTAPAGTPYYVLYYTAPTTRDGHTRQCIGTATSASPLGPFDDDHQKPLVCQYHHGGSIDPSVAPVPGTTGPNRPSFLLWKSDEIALQNGAPASLWARPLGPDGRSFTGPAHVLLTARPGDFPWERAFGGGQIEGPSVAYEERHDRFVLFYSAGPYDSPSYAMGYALCANYGGLPAGCARPPSAARGPWVRSAGGAYGPGGQEAFRGRGHWWFAYHAYSSTSSRAAASVDGGPRAYDPATVRAPRPDRGAAGLDAEARNHRIDKLCLAGGPWTNAPTAGQAIGTAR
ncbi:MAG: glycoside hydrolase, family 43, partial [Acidimicrobiales bacterium]|nr:glycoside hydrolase, family 43 [Acidimicrobiales bacterium]